MEDVGWVEGRNPTDQSLVLGFAALNPTYPSALPICTYEILVLGFAALNPTYPFSLGKNYQLCRKCSKILSQLNP